MKISQGHRNRQAHNWLIYDINDCFLEKNTRLYKGALYDLGAGEAPYKEFFLKHATTYVAVDWADSLHEIRADVVADLNTVLPIRSEVADTVVSLSVMEHLREPRTMLSEVFRILKPGGWLVAQVPWQWQIHEAPHDYFRYTPYGLEYLSRQCGFDEIHIEPQGAFFTMMVMKMNYFSVRWVRGPPPLRFVIRLVLSFFWWVGQKLAPYLDRIDRERTLETTGYFMTARKP